MLGTPAEEGWTDDDGEATPALSTTDTPGPGSPVAFFTPLTRSYEWASEDADGATSPLVVRSKRA